MRPRYSRQAPAAPDKKIDVLFVTLNKSDKDYSPTTMYEDYSISEELFHWQSQSTTSADSPTGLRYVNHEARGSRVLLFVREFKQGRRLHLPGLRPLRLARGQPPHERHLGVGPPDTGEVPEEDQQARSGVSATRLPALDIHPTTPKMGRGSSR